MDMTKAWAMLWVGMAASVAQAQAVVPVAKLDMAQFAGHWFEVARIPNRTEKHCLGENFSLYTVGDKPRRFAEVTSCKAKDGFTDVRNLSGKMDKEGDGRLKTGFIWPFTSKYDVIGVGPEYTWALLGTPNHKKLWILSRTALVALEVMAEIKAKAASEGFAMEKLVDVAAKPPEVAANR